MPEVAVGACRAQVVLGRLAATTTGTEAFTLIDDVTRELWARGVGSRIQDEAFRTGYSGTSRAQK